MTFIGAAEAPRRNTPPCADCGPVRNYPTTPAPSSIDFAALRYKRTGSNREKTAKRGSLKEITVNELHAIAFPKAKHTPQKPLSASGALVQDRLSKDKALRNVTVSEHDNQLAFNGVRFDQLAAFGHLVASLKLP